MWRSVCLVGLCFLLVGCGDENIFPFVDSPVLNETSLVLTSGEMRITEEEPLNISYADLSDDDFQKFVSVGQPFKNPQYEPSDLISLASTKSLTIQGNRSLRQEASEQLAQLSLAFYEVFKKPLVVMSAYRSYTYQKNQIAESCKQSGYCAREGESEHQLGLTVDLWEATNEEKFLAKYQAEYDRLVGNAWKWGFHQSYQKGKSVDGYAVEPWHWRYLREDLAKILWEKGMTFSELVRGK